jgi:hypothetical protein
MLLRIKRNETIRSYIARSTSLSENNKFAKWNSLKELTAVHIREVALLLGWRGCYGFNRLLHNHTYQPLHSVFKNSHDMAYSGRKYIAEYGDYEPVLPKCLSFCPECIRSDIDSFGFSYWRRNPFGSLTVCAAHNVLLESDCPICGEPFTSIKHGLNVMWEGCGGKHLGECVAKINTDAAELKRSSLLEEIFNYGFHISLELTLERLSLRFSMSPMTSQMALSQQDLDRLSRTIERQLSQVQEDRRNNDASYFERIDFDSVIDAIALLYDTFQDFIFDLDHSPDQSHEITSLWSTFRSGGHESAHYVQEDYSMGVGNWFCLYPSPPSLRLRPGDFARQLIPIIYPCCRINYADEHGVRRTKMWADPPHPSIPGAGLRN